ncbi:hypothetical protein EDB19DRAFT_1720802 [Suillus lakei]|nr:hypothetical protein EDB19DRAFT_1720802 [Suillus lakei]
MRLSLDSLDDDTLLGVFSALTVPDVLSLRQTCRRLLVLSTQQIVWQNIGSSQILQQGIPFSKKPLSSFSVRDLEDRVRRAYHLGKAWKAPSITFRASGCPASRGGPVQDIHFIPGYDRRWLITVSQGIWSMITLWDRRTLTRVTSWSPKKAVFSALTVNTSEDCEAALAVSLHRYDSVMVEILAITSTTPDSPPGFECIARLNTLRQPIAMCGSLLALADDEAETVIWNWKTQDYAVLQSPIDADLWRNQCTQVVFAHKTILVVRARSHPHPNTYVHHPYAQSTFGWGCLCRFLYARRMMTRGHPTFKIQLWTLSPMTASNETTVDGPHYNFPPSMTTEIVTPRRGALRCTDMVLGPYGTAVWVQPEDYSVAGLISSNVHLQNMPDEPQVKSSWKNYGENWTCLDYDEERGCVALGSTAGAVIILDI